MRGSKFRVCSQMVPKEEETEGHRMAQIPIIKEDIFAPNSQESFQFMVYNCSKTMYH